MSGTSRSPTVAAPAAPFQRQVQPLGSIPSRRRTFPVEFFEWLDEEGDPDHLGIRIRFA
jgi:hypothetical protein